MEGWKRKAKPPVVVDLYRFKRDRAGYLKAPATHLWLFDAETGKAEQLTKGPYDDGAPAWSPDGLRIAFVSDRGPESDRWPNSDLHVIEAKAGAEPRRLTDFPGPDGGRPAWSPDGRRIAFLRGDEPRYMAYNLNKLAVVPADGGPASILTGGARPRRVRPARLDPGRKEPPVHRHRRPGVLCRPQCRPTGGPVEALTTGRRTVDNITLGPDGALTLLAGTATEVDEVHALEPDGKLRRLSHQNDALLAELRARHDRGLHLEEQGRHRGQRPVGQAGRHTRPGSATLCSSASTAARTCRTSTASASSASCSPRTAMSCWRSIIAEAPAAARPSRRPSTGIGAARKSWTSSGPSTGLLPWASPIRTRLGIGGWSYGGILTDYTIATDPRFKAAISGAGSALQLSMYGSDQYIRQYETEIGVPWKAQEKWLRISYPFFQADRIRTPTLFLGGEKDFNVPIIGGEQMYQALKSLGVDTQLVVYPGQFHGISLPSYVRDRYERYLAWYGKYLKGAAS